MRYEPYEDEYAAVPLMTDAELMEYFLYRVFETEEVWGLKENSTKFIQEEGEQVTQPVWPYKRYAEEAAVGKWAMYVSAAVSLEFFMEQILHQLAREDVLLDIMPRPSGAGCLVSPQRLFSILEGMLESGEYSLDG